MTEEATSAVAGAAIAAAVEPPPAGDTSAAAPEPRERARSAGQALIDRFTEQSLQLQAIRQRLEAVRGVIDGGRKATEAEPVRAKPRPTSYFEGMSLIADFNAEVMDGLSKVVGELEALF